MRLTGRSLPLLALVALAACGGETPGEAAGTAMATLSGEVTYRERMALPLNATVSVRLLDVSRMDVPAMVISETTLDTRGKSVPLPFELAYDPARVQDNMSYAVRAEIRGDDGQLLWTTDTVHPVLTRGAPDNDVSIVLVRTGG